MDGRNKPGRPKKANNEKKLAIFKIRMSADEFARLSYIAETKGMSKADAVRWGLKLAYNITKFAD